MDLLSPEIGRLLAVRPEVIEIGANGHNNCDAKVQVCCYGRPTSHCRIAINDMQLELVTSPFHELCVDLSIVVHLPKNRIQVLPAEVNH